MSYALLIINSNQQTDPCYYKLNFNQECDACNMASSFLHQGGGGGGGGVTYSSPSKQSKWQHSRDLGSMSFKAPAFYW